MKPQNIGVVIEGVSRNFGKVRALESVTLGLEAGTLHGFIGPDGAGKTTLFRILSGLLKPGAGSISYTAEGRAVGFEDVRPYLAYMPSRSSLYPDLSIEEHLRFFKNLYSLPDAEYKTKSEELLAITKLDKFRDRKVGELSGGMYKKAGLMCALLRSPAAMLLDEPTNGVDPISRREFWELLYRLGEQKILVLISTAYMDEAERCAMVHLMDAGKVIMSGEPGTLLKQEGAKGFDEVFVTRADRNEKQNRNM